MPDNTDSDHVNGKIVAWGLRPPLSRNSTGDLQPTSNSCSAQFTAVSFFLAPRF
jgi:hypothetical protein